MNPTQAEVDRLLSRLEESIEETITAGSVPVDLTITPAEAIWLASIGEDRCTPFSQTTAYRQLQQDQTAINTLADLSRAMPKPELPWYDRPLSTRATVYIYAALTFIAGLAFFAIRGYFNG